MTHPDEHKPEHRGLIRRLSSWYVRQWMKPFMNTVASDVQHRTLFGAPISSFVRHLRHLHQAASTQDAPIRSFDELRLRWGIPASDAAIAKILLGMRIEIRMFAVIGAIAFASVVAGIVNKSLTWLGVIAMVLTTAVAGLVVLTRTWRIRCIERRQYASFVEWLTGSPRP